MPATSGLPSGTAASLPVAVPYEGGFADALFLFEADSPAGRPFAWAILHPDTGKLLSFSFCKIRDFVEPGAYPPDMPLPLETPEPITPEQKADGRRELLSLYEELRGFVFAKEPDNGQRELTERFSQLFETIAYVGHRPFYRALAPDFLGWLGISLPGGPPPAAGKEPDRAVAAIKELEALFKQKLMHDDHRQRLFDEMHRELQSYKNGLIDTLTRPMEEDIIKLIDDIEKSMDHYRGRQFAPDNYRRLLTLFEGVGTDLSDLLYRHGVEPFTQEGSAVTVGRQKVLATIPTDKPRQDKKVAVRHSRGWEKNGRVIRPERVSVYLYARPEEE
jgi:molecular chaperone GrpE (heat shock protein)